jgi:hypothetical protein
MIIATVDRTDVSSDSISYKTAASSERKKGGDEATDSLEQDSLVKGAKKPTIAKEKAVAKEAEIFRGKANARESAMAN